MALRDRRGPLVALVLSMAYALLLLQAAMAPLRALHWIEGDLVPQAVHHLVWLGFLGLLWRMAMRLAFRRGNMVWPRGCGPWRVFRWPTSSPSWPGGGR
jgi:adsorption protein B